MRTIIFAAALLGASALTAAAQTSTAPSTDANTPAVVTPSTKSAAAPVAGHNSFTQAQAKKRIEKAGYSAVTVLKLDDKGIWQSTATEGRQVRLGSLRLSGQHRRDVIAACPSLST
jgi:hypothetical protein